MIEQVRHFAVLIDGDNAQPKMLPHILEEVSKFGKATIRRIYGDWTQQQMNGWKEYINTHSFSPIQKFSYTTGKNSTDSALIIDAMDILHGKNTNGFCLVSSDSDYTGLAKRIREEGIFVMGIGEKKTPMAFVQSCEIFTYTENIISTEEAAATKSAQPKKPSKQKVQQELMQHKKLIDKAIELSLNEEDEAYISTIGNNLRKLDPSFDSRAYGHRSLTALFESLPDIKVIKTKTGDPVIKRTE